MFIMYNHYTLNKFQRAITITMTMLAPFYHPERKEMARNGTFDNKKPEDMNMNGQM